MIIFSGIRYAVADRQGRPVQEPALSSLENIETEVVACPQNPSRMDGVLGSMHSGEESSEDCLRLGVSTPALDGRRPVLVWIHGGAFVTGSGLYGRYGASELARRGDIVVVSINYRLGALGFLYDPDNDVVNLGLEDQVCALRWIKTNIAIFGGDPANITVFGQSAGAYSVLCHIAGLREPLFRRAVIASAPFLSVPARRMRAVTSRFLSSLGGDMENATIGRILEAQREVERKSGGMPFAPVCPYLASPRQIMPGLDAVALWCQQDDARVFVRGKLLSVIGTWLIFKRPMMRYAGRLERSGIRVSTRIFLWRHADGPFGACHCLELPLIFGGWDLWKDAPFLSGVTREEFLENSSDLQEDLCRFVRSE